MRRAGQHVGSVNIGNFWSISECLGEKGFFEKTIQESVFAFFEGWYNELEGKPVFLYEERALTMNREAGFF